MNEYMVNIPKGIQKYIHYVYVDMLPSLSFSWSGSSYSTKEN